MRQPRQQIPNAFDLSNSQWTTLNQMIRLWVVGKKAMAVAAKALGDETLFASLHQLALKVDHEMRS
jgi:hypothetical protein